MSADIMVEDSVRKKETFISGLHHAVTVFDLAAVEHVVWIGKPDLSHGGEAIEASRPDCEMTQVMPRSRCRGDRIKAAAGEYPGMAGFACLDAGMQAAQEGRLLLQAPRPGGVGGEQLFQRVRLGIAVGIEQPDPV